MIPLLALDTNAYRALSDRNLALAQLVTTADQDFQRVSGLEIFQF